ncbi:MAG: SpoIIE family protein phosphatase [Planctomycetota bacterium]
MPDEPTKKRGLTRVIEDPILKFIMELGRAIEFFRLYPETHPYVLQAFTSVYESAETALRKATPFTFGVSSEGIFVQGEKLDEIPTVLNPLAHMFKRLSISSLAIQAGIREDELGAFVKLVSDRDQMSMRGEEVEVNTAEILRQFKNIEVNTYTYEQVTSQEGKLLKKVKDVAKTTSVDSLHVLDMLLKGSKLEEVEGAEGANLTAAIENNPEEVACFIKDVIKEAVEESGMSPEAAAKAGGVLADEKLEPLRTLSLAPFNKVALSLVAHKDSLITELKEKLNRVIKFLPPQDQALLFGKEFKEGEEVSVDKVLTNISKTARARTVLNEISRSDGDTSEDLKNKIMSLLRNKSELGNIVEMAAKQANNYASKEMGEETLSKLFAAIQSGIKVSYRGKAIIVDPDVETSAIAKSALLAAGLDVAIFTDPIKALDKMKKTPPDLLITEMKLLGLHGIDLLRSMRRLPKTVPAIIWTKYESFKREFEVVTYPSHVFLVKPTPFSDLANAIEELLPREEEPEAAEAAPVMDEARQEELESAKEIQQALLPQDIPKLMNIDIATSYYPCREVGGDYFDIITLPDNKYGIFLADVAGKGVPAAMITVLIRSLLRIAAPINAGASSTIVQLNRMLSKEIKEGLFVSAVYVLLEPEKRTASICSAGHCPTLLWNTGKNEVQAQYIKHTGMVLGLGDTPYFINSTKEQVIQLERHSGILLYTDGVIEAINGNGELYGEERLETYVTENVTNGDAKMLNENLVKTVNRFSDPRPQHDDITIISIKCYA